MLPFLLLLAGGAVSLYSLWQFRRWLGEPAENGSGSTERLQTLVDELIATAETTSAVIQERAGALLEVIAQADERIAALSAAAASQTDSASAAPGPSAAAETTAPVSAPAPNPAPAQPDLHRRVYALADAGHDVTAIARQLSLTKGEVLLVLGLRRGEE